MTENQRVPGPEWVKSSLSFANGNCVEVSGLGTGEILVRNSSDLDGEVLRFTPAEWDAFTGGVHLGEFDRFGAASPGQAAEHYREAERLAGEAADYEDLPSNHHVQLGQLSQVHAFLALADAVREQTQALTTPVETPGRDW